MPPSIQPPRASAMRRSLIAATFLTPAAMLAGGVLPAMAAQLPVVASPVADPLLDGLAIPDDAPTRGMWSGVRNWPIIAVSAVMLPTGKVLTFGAPPGANAQDGRTYIIWDPTKGFGDGSQTVLPGVAGVNSFCAAQTFQLDGSLLIAGGIFDNGTDRGSAVLNPTGTGVAGIGAKLANDRYYSTMVTLPDGRPVIVGGSYPYQGGWADPQGSIDKGLMTGMTPEIFENGNWRSLFGANSRAAFGPDNNRFWYPRAWTAPNGQIFGISSDNMWYLDPAGTGKTTTLPFRAAQKAANVATAAPNTGPNSTAAMYDIGKILQVGGNSYDNGSQMLASSLATVVDINGATPVATETAPATYGRSWANATVLPTGKVLVNGGSLFGDNAGDKTVLATEIWDPATGRWSVGAANGTYRGYHSTATLLQDGAVLVAGGGIPGPIDNLNAEIYYPPYLFTTVNGKAALAPRPQIVSLSSNKLALAQSMRFEVADAAGLSQVVLVGLSQTTHSFNNGQRRIPVTFTQAGTLVTAQTPASANIAPPGYYQLVAIDAKGVPSPGVIVAVGAVAAPAGAVTVPTNPASLAGGTTWTACAVEGGTCTVPNGPKTVRFGANGQFVTKPVTGATPCTNEAFGKDPLVGTVKACQIAATDTTGTGTGGTAGGTGTGGTTGGTGTGGTAGGTGTGGTTGGTGTAGGTGGTGTTGGTAGPVAGGPFVQPGTGAWTEIGIFASKIASAADGTTVTINKDTGVVWQYVADNAWKALPGTMKDVAVVKANSIYGIGTDDVVHRFDGTKWTAIPSANNVRIAAAADGTVAVVNKANEIWIKPTDDAQANWRRLPGTARKVVPMSGKSFWAIGLDNNVYRSDGVGGWVYVGNNASDIAASADGSVIVVNSNGGGVWRKVGDNAVEAWAQIPNGKATVVAAPSSQRALAIGLDAKIYRY